MNKKTARVIVDWYQKLYFPIRFFDEFLDAVARIDIPSDITLENYDTSEQDGKRNLLSFLFFCKALEKKYNAAGIPQEILYDTLQDIVRWTVTWSNIKGELYLGELLWLKLHLSGRLFKLGRLQYEMCNISHDVPEKGIKKGDPVINVHIPATGPLKKEDCEKSLETARKFFAEYFPDFSYKYFTCHSWLLSTELDKYLPEKSNILQFQTLFDIVSQTESDDILKFVFTWDTTRNNLSDKECKSIFSKKVKYDALNGAVFYAGEGFINR